MSTPLIAENTPNVKNFFPNRPLGLHFGKKYDMIMDMKRHIFELEELNNALTLCCNIMKITITLFDADLTPVLDVCPEKTYCLAIRKNPELLEKCKHCDRENAREALKHPEPYIYTCHAGIAEAVGPVYIDDTLVGYLMIGKFKDVAGHYSSVEVVSAKLDQYAKYDLDKEDMLRAYSELPTLDKESVDSAIFLLQMLICFIRDKNLVHAAQSILFDEIKKYIAENLYERITVDQLCNEFKLTYTNLHALIKHCFGKSLPDLINSIRLEKAKYMLTHTKDSISDIGISLGFGKSSKFSHFFKEKMQMGVTPMQYRKNHLYNM